MNCTVIYNGACVLNNVASINTVLIKALGITGSCQAMESDESRWLKRNYRPAPSDGPSAKKVKYSDIYTGLVSTFPSKTFNHSSVSATIHSTLPNTTSKVLGHSRTKHIIGLEHTPYLEDDTVPGLKAEI